MPLIFYILEISSSFSEILSDFRKPNFYCSLETMAKSSCKTCVIEEG